MRKFLAAILSLVCLACLGLAVACTSAPDYYELTYGAIDGVTLDFGEIQNGAKVKDGYEVKFEVIIDESAVTGEPTVTVNGKAKYPAADTMPRLIYSFTMEEDAYVTVEGVYSVTSNDIIFNKGEWRLTYTDLEGNELTELKDVSSGETVEFKLNFSVYYDKNSKFSVLANTQVAKYDAEREVYSFIVRNNTTVSVSGLELEETFLSRENGGSGTADDPFSIERPIDLYAMADLVNNDFHNGAYGLASYKLNADIDMQGEQLFIIGDGTGNYAAFMGDFNGNGHTIKNYYISDTIVEQSEFSTVFMNYVGLFGQAVATVYGPVNIYGLTLENFEIKVDAGKYKAQAFVGGLVGAGIGLNVTNCNVLNGKITADADSGNYTNVGGLVGVLQSGYSATLSYNSSVSHCYSTVTISGDSGYVYTGGGLVGYLLSADETANAFIINSAYSGEVTGAMNAGGIVGYVGSYSSVKNCWSNGEAVAVNHIRQSTGYEEYLYAYAGGIAGYIDHNAVVSGSFSIAWTSANASSQQYAKNGDIAGGIGEADPAIIESFAGAIINCTASPANNNQNYFTGTLGWSTADWSFGGEYPAVKANNGAKSATVTTVCGETSGTPLNISSANYRTVYEWYSNGLDEFVTSNGLRSYGYYFDKELTQKVPTSYVLTGNERLYYGLADYNEISGVYYLQTAVKGSGIYLELYPDGTLVYREGARHLTTSYIYDGEKATLFGCPAFTEQIINYVYNEAGERVLDDDGNPVTTITEYFSGAVAELGGGKLKLTNNLTYTSVSPLFAVKEIEGFAYGGYYAGESEYYFYTDGTGKIGNRDITYTVSGNEITVNDNGTVINGAVENGKVTALGETPLSKFDPFKGTWEKSATTRVEYTFDGKGGWTYEFYEYINGKKQVIKSDNGNYTYDSSDNTLELEGGVRVGFDNKGMLLITDTKEETYYGNSSLVGTWRYAYKPEAIEITFGGIGKGGYGVATVRYETLNADIEFTYHVAVVDGVEYVYLFDEEIVMGMLYYNTDNFTLGGYIYSFKEDTLVYYYLNGEDPVFVVAFCLYDDYRGEWLGEDWGIVNFNGLGSYNLKGVVIGGETINVATSGSVSIKGTAVSYKLENATMSGSLVYGGVTYSLSYDGIKDEVTVTPANGESFKLVRPDSLYGLKLLASDKTVYEFDGGSAHENGGTVIAGAQTYKYKISDNGDINLYADGVSVGKITVNANNSYVLSIGANEEILTIENDFTGSWYVSGTLQTIVIGSINANYEANGSYLGTNVTFKYVPATDRLKFVYNNMTYYVSAMFSAKNGKELRISDSDDIFASSVYAISIEARDGYQGTYVANGGEMLLDGFSDSAYTKGAAIFTGNIVGRYSYSVNEFGMIELRSGKIYKLLVETDKTAVGAYVMGDTAYKVVDPDGLYLVKPADYFETVYTFNGLGTVKTDGGKTFAYTIIPQTDDDIKNLICRMTFEDGDGKAYAVEFDYSTSDYKVTFTDELTGVSVYKKIVSGFGGSEWEYTYKFVWAGYIEFSNTYYNKFGNLTTDVELYTYVIDKVSEDKKVYNLTVTYGDGTTASAVLDLGAKDGPTLEFIEAKDDLT